MKSHSNFVNFFLVFSIFIFSIVLIIKSIILSKHKINPFSFSFKKFSLKNFFLFTPVVLTTIWIFLIINEIFNIVNLKKMSLYDFFSKDLSLLLNPDFCIINFIKILGIIFIIFAFVFFISGIININDSYRIGIDEKTPGRLVTNGIFKISRNPIFLFFILYYLGVFLIFQNIIFFIFLILIIINLHYQILQEEDFLEKKYGIEYLNYKKNVRRYL